MKNKIMLLVLLIVLIIPIRIEAATADTKVGYNLNQNECTRNTNDRGYQDRNISTSGEAYFSHCIQATCGGNGYDFKLKVENEGVNCLNGNTDPYYEVYKNGCSNYENKRCNYNSIDYCSVVLKYDCSRKRDGSPITTTTKSTTKKTTKRTTTKKTTVSTTTTEVVKKDTRLKSLTLSYGSIIFNSDIYSYDLIINEDINSINVTAVPIDETSTVTVNNNTNLENGSIISVIVKGTDGNSSQYKINIKKNKVLSNNTKLSMLSIENYDLRFVPSIKEYNLELESELNALKIDYRTDDTKSTVTISNNSNLVNGSKITIAVKAEDGTVGYYYVNIIIKEKSNSLGIIFIIILILALIAGAYYIYKKIIVPKQGEKYEYE